MELGVALERNKTLRVLWLSWNAIGDDGVRGLCVGLENNLSLEELYLNGDKSLGEEGVSLLLKCVEEKNTSLKTLLLPNKYKRDISSVLQSRCEVDVDVVMYIQYMITCTYDVNLLRGLNLSLEGNRTALFCTTYDVT